MYINQAREEFLGCTATDFSPKRGLFKRETSFTFTRTAIWAKRNHMYLLVLLQILIYFGQEKCFPLCHISPRSSCLINNFSLYTHAMRDASCISYTHSYIIQKQTYFEVLPWVTKDAGINVSPSLTFDLENFYHKREYFLNSYVYFN